MLYQNKFALIQLIQLFNIFYLQRPQNMKGNSQLNGTVNFPYFRRTNIFQNRLTTRTGKHYQHRYKFLGIASNFIKGVQIYLHYFPSIYTKKYYQLIQKKKEIKRLEKEHVSLLFHTYLQIYILRGLLGPHSSLTGLITTTVNDLIESKKSKQEELLFLFLKMQVTDYHERKYKSLFKAKYSIQNYFQNAKEIQGKIKQILNELYKTIDDQQKFKQIKEKQFLPQGFPDHLAGRVIKENFKSICNIKVMQKSRIKEILLCFHSTVKFHTPMYIPIIMETDVSDKDSMMLPSNSVEKYPILTQIINYLIQFHILKQEKQFDIFQEDIMRSILNFCCTYNKDTKRCFPKISIKYIYFDQKKLIPIVSFEPLILDAIGLTENTKCFELRLATEPTPKGIDYEESHLQMIEQSKIKLNRKYYFPIKEENIQIGEQNGLQNNNNRIIKKEVQLLEQIHVWRLISIFYYILNGSNFTNDYYNQKLKLNSSLNKIQIKPKPFYMQQYIQSLQRAYNDIKNKTLHIEKIIPLRQNYNKYFQNQQFNFTLSEIKDYFGVIDNEDSLMQGLQFTKIREYFYERYLLTKEIKDIIFTQNAFKKLINPKKYFLIYFVLIYEDLYFRAQTRNKVKTLQLQNQRLEEEQIKNQKANPFSKKQMKMTAHQLFMLSLQKQINKVCLPLQFQGIRKICRQNIKKLEDYTTRKDMSGEYIRKNIHYFNKAKEMQQRLKQIIIYLDFLQIIKDTQNQEKQQEQYKQILINLQQLCREEFEQVQYVKRQMDKIKFLDSEKNDSAVIKNSIKLILQNIQKTVEQKIDRLLVYIRQTLQDFIQSQLKKDLQKPESLHKVSDFMTEDQKKKLEIDKKVNERALQVGRYYNLKLKTLIKVYRQLNHENLKAYLYYQNILIDQQNSKTRKKKIYQLSYDEIKFQIQKLKIIQQYFINYYEN